MKIDHAPGSLILICALIFICGCAVLPSGRVGSSEDDTVVTYPLLSSEDVFVLTCKVRLDLPKYRIRGSCRISRFPDGSLEINFLHSSLFGSYREDLSLYIDSESIVIQDHEREMIYDNETTLSLLEEHFGFPIYADDLTYLLLFAEPVLDGSPEGGEGAGKSVHDTDRWRGRKIFVTGGENGMPVSIRQCVEASTICYITRYGYGRHPGYPEKIVIENESGPERVILDVLEVKEEKLTTD